MISKTDKLTPSIKRLLIEFMAKRQIDRANIKNTDNQFGLVASIASDIALNGLGGVAEAALSDVNAALLAMRNAGEPNSFKDSTDEQIAAAILSQLNQRRSVLKGKWR